MRRLSLGPFASAAALLLIAGSARGDILESDACRVFFPADARSIAERVLSEFPKERALAAAWLGVMPAGRPVVHLVDGYRAMAAAAGPGAPAWAVAVTRGDDLLAFRLDKLNRNRGSDLRTVLRHEIVHHCVNHFARGSLPRWFEEGLCVHWAGTAYLQTTSSIESMAAAGRLPSLAAASQGFLADAGTAGASYEIGKSAVEYLLERHGAERLRELLGLVREGESFSDAFEKATGEGVFAFEEAWRQSVTPNLPFLVDFFFRHLELNLLVIAGVLVVIGGVRKLRARPKEMSRLGPPSVG
ncbi:MAG: hypothetical protein V3T86_09795 [Planctomycetota bacterium]